MKAKVCDKPPYEGWRIYGPYAQKCGRLIVNAVLEKVKLTVSYPKFLMELHMGRRLDPTLETVDHIDRNSRNNEIQNLRVVTLAENARDDALRIRIPELPCVWCEKPVPESRAKHAYREMKAGRRKAGPFCSRPCAGRYSAAVQRGEIVPFPSASIPVEFYYNDKVS